MAPCPDESNQDNNVAFMIYMTVKFEQDKTAQNNISYQSWCSCVKQKLYSFCFGGMNSFSLERRQYSMKHPKGPMVEICCPQAINCLYFVHRLCSGKTE